MGQPNQAVRRYLSAIGRRGGRSSRRRLDSASAAEMVRVREAKRAYRKFFAQCFWFADPDLVVTKQDVAWVAEQLMKHGSQEGWQIGRRLCP